MLAVAFETLGLAWEMGNKSVDANGKLEEQSWFLALCLATQYDQIFSHHGKPHEI